MGTFDKLAIGNARRLFQHTYRYVGGKLYHLEKEDRRQGEQLGERNNDPLMTVAATRDNRKSHGKENTTGQTNTTHRTVTHLCGLPSMSLAPSYAFSIRTSSRFVFSGYSRPVRLMK